MAQYEWTAEKPTQPGWYWWRSTAFKAANFTGIASVYSNEHGLFAVQGNWVREVSEVNDREWAGPILTPEEFTAWMRDEGVFQS